jgi:hypothetical protein
MPRSNRPILRCGHEGTIRRKAPRSTAEELDVRVAIPLDPAAVIEGMMQVDAE